MPLYNTEALSLRLQPFREANGLALLFTRERGQVTALCQGIRKMRSSLASAAQPGTYFLASLAQGSRWDILTQAEVRDYFPEIRADLPRLSAALYVLELIAGAVAPGQKDEALFDAALELLRSLKSHPEPLALVTAFELRLLDLHGIPLSLDKCAVCGSAISGDQWVMSTAAGGRICPRCKERTRSLSHLTPQSGQYLLAVSGADLSSVPPLPHASISEIRGLLSRFIAYHLGQDFKSRKFMNSVLLPRTRRR